MQKLKNYIVNELYDKLYFIVLLNDQFLRCKYAKKYAESLQGLIIEKI